MAGGRGCGCSPGLGRNTSVDELVFRVNSSIGYRNQGPSSVRRSPVSPRLEALVSMMERTVGTATPSGVHVEETIRDRGIL